MALVKIDGKKIYLPDYFVKENKIDEEFEVEFTDKKGDD